MATARAEMFDTETFAKLVALFDSNNAGEAESAFRKSVLMCAKAGMRFCDVAGTVFGPSEAVDTAEFERLKQSEAKHASEMSEAAAEVNRLRDEVGALREQLDARTPDGEHVIDLPGRLRHAWKFAQFRLLVLTLAIGAGITAEHHSGIAAPLGFLCLFLFAAWSVAQFHKRGFAQMLLKWLVYGIVLLAGGVTADAAGSGDRPVVFAAALLLALVLTLTKVSYWLGELIRVHIWESDFVRAIRRWF